LAALGLRLGHLSEVDVALITFVGIITITISSYTISKGNAIYNLLSPYLDWMELPNAGRGINLKGVSKKSIILIGAHRTGQSILHNLSKKEVRVVDFDPEAINDLKRKGYDYIFGDIADQEILEQARVADSDLVIATGPNFEDNVTLVEEIKEINKARHKKIKIIVRAKSASERDALYASGANYVLWPHFTAGQYLGRTVHKEKNLTFLKEWRKHDFELIRKEEDLDQLKLQHSAL
jgi:Trk K+ transport system NAD-binding subunit